VLNECKEVRAKINTGIAEIKTRTSVKTNKNKQQARPHDDRRPWAA